MLFSTAWLFVPMTGLAEATPTELRQADDGWQLFRDGEPFLVKGAGGSSGSMERLVAAGANSTRTWGAEDLEPMLDEAHELGIAVTIGIWLGHERHGFDYNDEAQVQAQFEKAREYVLRYKDHPALLIWGVGNEMEGFAEGDNPLIWKAVNDIAAMIKELDPHHPTMTITAEIGGGRISSVNEYAPDIDIHGINAYGGGASLADRYRAGGGTKPIIITEFGPPGSWETGTAEWGAPFEMTSTAKADAYRRTYENSVLGQPGLAIGSYAFIWGHKMEATTTWFGMFLPDGSRLAAVDTMTELWSGEKPADLAPAIEWIAVKGDEEVDPGDVVQARVELKDPEDGKLTTQWVLRPESGEYSTGGDFRPMLPDIEGAIIRSDLDTARVRMPEQPGPYRLYLYAYDEAGNAATANIPLLIKGERRTPLPFYVYQDSFDGMLWSPSGWMGNYAALALDGDFAEGVQQGSAAVKVSYSGQYGWAGIAWQNPPNNWGDQDGGIDLTGATAMELWARGGSGGENVGFGVGIIGTEKAHPDSAKKMVNGVVLTDEWQRYTVPLEGLDLSSIKTGFVITLTGRSKPVEIYLDNIRFVRD